MSWLDETLSNIFGTDDDQTNTLIGLGGSLLLNQTGLGQAQIPQTGYQGSIPDYKLQRRPVTTMPKGVTDQITTMAEGGIAKLRKGRYLTGETDGMADEVRANIDGTQEARLSDGEYVIPADVVSHLGNGNSDAGAKVLDKMLDRVRKARTGNEKQGKEIDPKKFLPA